MRPRPARACPLAAAACILVAACSTGCAIRYDAAGVTRVGVGLWGFGDPPGVQWDLGAPRREIPELPAARYDELPPRTMPGWPDDDAPLRLPRSGVVDRTAMSIEDNDEWESRGSIDIACLSGASRFLLQS